MSSSTVTKLAGRPNVVLGDNYGDDVDPSRWVVMYPPYIDSVRTEKQGRKIGKEKCVEKPLALEIFDCAQLLGFQTALELDKAYCRDYWQRGRVRIRLFDTDKKPTREDIPSRRVLYAKVGALIPEHREKAKAAQAIKKNPSKQGNAKGTAQKGDVTGKGTAAGKGAAVVPKKKKKGKR